MLRFLQRSIGTPSHSVHFECAATEQYVSPRAITLHHTALTSFSETVRIPSDRH